MSTDDERDTFSEGHPRFEEMLIKGIEFISYFARWNGLDPLPSSALTQQDKLGIARSMFRAITLENVDGGQQPNPR